MAQVVRVHKLASNPHRRRRRPRRNRARRRLTARQIRYFGSPAQKAALRRKQQNRRRKPNRGGHRRRTTHNPALVIPLGAINPRRNRVARRRKHNRRSHSHRGRRRNVTRIVVRAPRRHHNPRRRRSHHNVARYHNVRRRRHNPSLFGATVSTGVMAQAVLGGLVGVTAAKLIPAALPASLRSTPTMQVIAAGASAFAAGWAAGKVNRTFGDAVLFGGLMQTGSMLLNAFVPSVGRQIGLGDLVDGRFVVPQNPLRLPAPAAAPAPGPNARVTMSGLSRAFGTAF